MADEEDKMRAALSPEVMEMARKALGTTPVYVLADVRAEGLAENDAPQFTTDRETAQTLLSEIASLPPAALSFLGAKIAELQAVAQGAARKLPMSAEALRAAFDQAREAAEATARAESPGQKAERLLLEIKALNTEITADLEQLHRDGFVGDEEYKKLKKERERLDKLDDNDPTKPQAEKQYNDQVKEIAERAETAAKEQGNHESAGTAKRMGGNAEKANGVLEQLRESTRKAAEAGSPEHFEVANVSLDDFLASPPTTSSGSPGVSKPSPGRNS